MPLTTGTRLGFYEVIATLGTGGMGEVYRARDTRLGREVALKILPGNFASSPERLDRFDREAKLLASLSHQNIAAIHGLEEEGGTPFLVLELVEGEDLAERLLRGPLPQDEAIAIARQIAEALAAAHEKGIVHRDLKPANIKVTPAGVVKVLDFGLATTEAPVGSDESTLRTLSRGPTLAGTVLGTPAYMSPEQARGKPTGHATDLWSFGCVLFEMLAGRRPFTGETASDLMVSILTKDPDWRALPRSIPPPVAALLRRCLDREAPVRPTARDAALALIRIQDDLRAGKRPGMAAPLRLVLGVALLLAAAGLGAWIMRSRDEAQFRAPVAPPPPRSLSALTTSAGIEQWPSFSPDGGRLLFSAERDGFAQLFVKDLATGDETQLTREPKDSAQPAWAPDGRTIAFVRASGPGGRLEISDALTGSWEGGDVWLLDLASGQETLGVEEAFNPAFSPDGLHLAFDASRAGPRRIWTTDARGRNPRQVTTDTSEAIQHTRPAWSPDGLRIVFQQNEKTKLDVRVADVATGETAPVTNDLYMDLDPFWSPKGDFIYFSSYRGGGLNVWRLPVSETGVPEGPPGQLTTGAGQDVQPALSPDGTRLVFTVLSQNADLWRLPVDPATGAMAGEPEPIVVSTREDSRGAWSPDGRTLAFNSDRGGEMNLWLHAIQEKAARQLTKGAGGDYQANWSPDGRSIAFFSSRSGNTDIWTVEVATGALRQVTDDPALDVNPFFSPDGATIAFQSDRDGRKEVWLVGADGSNPRQLGHDGAADHFMRWSDDGRYVYFRSTALSANGVCRIPASGGAAEALGFPVGWHLSFSPDRRLLLDVVGHQRMLVYPMDGQPPRPVFDSGDPDVRVDYPQWSPDGRWVVFDRVSPQGGDVWLLDGVR